MAPPIQLKVVTRLEEINRAGWDALRDPGNMLVHPAYLKAVEEANVVPLKAQYLEFYKDDKLIGFLVAYIIDNDIALYIGKIFFRVCQTLRRVFPGFFKIKTLEIGSPINAGIPVAFSPSITCEDSEAVVEHVIAHAQKNDMRLILVRDFIGLKATLEEVLQDKGFQELINYPLAWMRVPWQSFDEYLAQMNQRHRYNVRKKLRQKENAGITTVIAGSDQALFHVADYVVLCKKVAEHSKEYPRETIGEDYHQAMVRNMSGKSHWLQYFQGDKLVAFVHLLQHADTLYYQYVGLDYEVSHDAALYFNSFHDTILFAIEQGIPKIEAGVTTYRAKSAAGFSVIPQRMYLWHQSLKLSAQIARAFHKFTDYETDTLHQVFNDSKIQYLWDGKARYIEPP